MIQIVLLISSICYCQNDTIIHPSTGEQTVTIPISYIKLANIKLIENKYNKLIINEQYNIIDLYKNKEIEYNKNIKTLQYKIIEYNDINNKLIDNNNKQKKKNKTLKYISISSIAFGILTIITN